MDPKALSHQQHRAKRRKKTHAEMASMIDAALLAIAETIVLYQSKSLKSTRPYRDGLVVQVQGMYDRENGFNSDGTEKTGPDAD